MCCLVNIFETNIILFKNILPYTLWGIRWVACYVECLIIKDLETFDQIKAVEIPGIEIMVPKNQPGQVITTVRISARFGIINSVDRKLVWTRKTKFIVI